MRYARKLIADGLQSSLFFESPEEIYARVFRELKPRTPVPGLKVEFCEFANADSFIQEALAHILLGKLYRKPIARMYNHRYRLYLNRKDVRRQAQLVRQIRGRKFISGPKGEHYQLDEIFERLNGQFFDGLMGRPQLGWSRGRSRSMLGHFDPSHNAIIISRILDQPTMALALEYVMFHEMLHLQHPVEHGGARRRVHTREFREAEKKFPRLKEAKELLKKL
jgi:SprT-like family protein